MSSKSNCVRFATWARIGESSSTMVELSAGTAGAGLEGLKNSESPPSFRSNTVGIVMPPAGPKVADLSPESI